MAGLTAGRGDAPVDIRTHRAAVEAVVGVSLKGSVDEEKVRAWLDIVFHGNADLIARSMHYAQRMIHGPEPDA
jgi:hypothetical protein